MCYDFEGDTVEEGEKTKVPEEHQSRAYQSLFKINTDHLELFIQTVNLFPLINKQE